MTNSQKIDFLYSKFISPNREQTSVFNSQIWTQGDEIPTTLPQFDQNGEYKNSSGEVILKRFNHVKMDPISGFSNAFSSPEVYDVISFENGFDSSYEYKFYNRSSTGTYTEIPFGEGGYFFDHDTGVLFFPEGRSTLYNPSSLYIGFVKYVGQKGIDGSSQFSGSPQFGPVGPTGPTGEIGETGPTDPFSLRYKGTWSSSLLYSKWNIVKHDGKFFVSTINLNEYMPTNGAYWQPFGVPQLSTTFNTPDGTYWVSPGFSSGGGRYNNLDDVFTDINLQSFQNTTVFIYPGDYVIGSTVIARQFVNINFVFYGPSTISFIDDTMSLVFPQNNIVEMRGDEFSWTNGSIRISCSSLSLVGGSLNNVQLLTTNMSDVSRLMAVDASLNNMTCYGSFASLRNTNIIGNFVMDEVSVAHIEGCIIQAVPDAELNQEKISIVSTATSGTPPGFGFEHPALLIKNSRILSNSSVLYSTASPSYGFRICVIASSLYVKDSSTSFLDFSNQFDAFIVSTVVNTTYDDTKLNILNVNGGFQTITANFED